MSLQIELQNISKKYLHHYIIKDFSYLFSSQTSYAILGSNGSGKSTLIKLLSGLHTPTKGSIVFKNDELPLSQEKIYSYVSLVAPWSNTINDFTLRECLSFYFKFRNPILELSVDDIITISGMEIAENKLIHQYSSGMKQRVRLLLGFFTDSSLLLLDEPTSNLDANGKEWYCMLVEKYHHNRLVIVASNHMSEEYSFCKEAIELK